MNDRETVEKRLENMKKLYLRINQLIDEIPESIPSTVRDMIRDNILGDKDLKELMEGIDHHRPPRFLLVGRTGVGKSSLINALVGTYLAQVSDTESCTPGIQLYKCQDQGKTLMEVLDTRGIAESDQLDDRVTAEQHLLEHVNEFSPDAAIFLLSCTHRDSVGEDADYLREVIEKYESLNHVHLPVVLVVTRADGVAPDRIKVPKEYPERKIDAIDTILRNYKGVLTNHGLKVEKAIAVSSCIDWMTEDGEEVSVESINNMDESEIAKLQIAFDGRYQIEELRDMLEDVIEDFQAKMGLRMALRLDELVRRLAKRLTHIFAGISSIVALTPIPISDIYILLIVQATLVAMIAALSGREINLDTAKEFITSLAGVGGLGWLLRVAAQQLTKFANLAFPGSGSVISSGIAASGTETIGRCATAYYIDDKTMEEVMKIKKQADKENKE